MSANRADSDGFIDTEAKKPSALAGVPSQLGEGERAQIAAAAQYLESPGFLLRAAALLGRPAESLMARLPARLQKGVARGVQAGLEKALEFAIQSISLPAAAGRLGQLGHDSALHTAAAAATGLIGGFFGAASLPVEMPITTVLMLRAIAQVAQDCGADLQDPAVRLECLQVLGLGGPRNDNASVQAEEKQDPVAVESAYYGARLGLAMAMRSASQYVARASAAELSDAVARGTAPILVKLLGQIANRFQVVVGEKALAQAVPLLGAASGAALNAAFMEHFQHVARHHFTLRSLEQRHGESAVRAAYATAMPPPRGTK